MIELISILCSLAICIFTPIEVERIRNGWTGKRFADDRGKFLAAYRKQLMMLIWLGVGFGVITLVLTFIEPRAGERIVKICRRRHLVRGRRHLPGVAPPAAGVLIELS